MGEDNGTKRIKMKGGKRALPDSSMQPCFDLNDLLKNIEMAKACLAFCSDEIIKSPIFAEVSERHTITLPALVNILDLIIIPDLNESRLENICQKAISTPLLKWLEIIQDLSQQLAEFYQISGIDSTSFVQKIQKKLQSLQKDIQDCKKLAQEIVSQIEIKQNELKNKLSELNNFLRHQSPLSDLLIEIRTISFQIHQDGKNREHNQANASAIFSKTESILKTYTAVTDVIIALNEKIKQDKGDHDLYKDTARDCQRQIEAIASVFKMAGYDLPLDPEIKEQLRVGPPFPPFSFLPITPAEIISHLAEFEDLKEAVTELKEKLDQKNQPIPGVKKVIPAQAQNPRIIKTATIDLSQESIDNLIFAAYAVFARNYRFGPKGKGSNKIARILIYIGAIPLNHKGTIKLKVSTHLKKYFTQYIYVRKNKEHASYELKPEYLHLGLTILEKYPGLEELILQGNKQVDEVDEQ